MYMGPRNWVRNPKKSFKRQHNFTRLHKKKKKKKKWPSKPSWFLIVTNFSILMIIRIINLVITTMITTLTFLMLTTLMILMMKSSSEGGGVVRSHPDNPGSDRTLPTSYTAMLLPNSYTVGNTAYQLYCAKVHCLPAILLYSLPNSYTALYTA